MLNKARRVKLQTCNIQFVKDETFCLGITLVEVC